MTHSMKLKDNPFNKIASGEKTIELRLYDEKRKKDPRSATESNSQRSAILTKS